MIVKDKVYVGDVGTAIIVDCQQDISGATNVTLEIQRPDRTEVSKAGEVATIDGLTRYVRYVTVAGDLNQSGDYNVQPKLTLDGWNGLGHTATFTVYKKYH